MNTIYNEYTEETIINKSIFIAFIKNITTVNEAKDYLQLIKKKFPDANHHVSAYIIGKNAEIAHASDDKEPNGTAGLPVLDVLKKNNLTNVICIVVRYFGGIKLGAGGLIRAYSNSASNVVSIAKVEPIIEYTNIVLTFDYALLDLLQNRLQAYEIIQKSFSTNVTMMIKVPLLEQATIINNIISSTNGLVSIRIKENEENL